MIAAWALAALTALPVRAEPPGRASVQIAILRQAESVRIAAGGAVRVVPPRGKSRLLGWRGSMILKPDVGGLRLAGDFLPSETRLEPEGGSILRVDQNPHRGALILRLDPAQTVTVIEELPLEEYLEGVLPHEMDPSWPLEALKAQAVVARTFAYANLGKFRKDGFDLTADTDSQVYRGRAEVNARVRDAVSQTRGEVLGWKGKLLRAYYHACCGGATESAGRAWGMDDVPRPLRGVADPWCRSAPPASWTAAFPLSALTAAVETLRSLPGPLTGLRVGRRDAAGRVLWFLARAGRQTFEIPAGPLRRALGADELRSTKIRRLAFSPRGVSFAGAGAGHGVGLCQWGARRQAEAGRAYERILAFYFPGSELSEIAP